MIMNEKGFFTLIGICFLLIAAILVKGVQESERNYSYVTRDFKDEVELQNIADSALLEAVEMIKSNEVELIESKSSVSIFNRKENQYNIIDKTVDGAKVQVFYEYGKIGDDGNIYFLKRTYSRYGYSDGDFIKGDDNKVLTKKGVILISVASRKSDNNIMNDKKIYRRSLGYFLTDGDEDGKIYFMNSLNDD